MLDEELVRFGKDVRRLAENPFQRQLEETRREWKRRKSKQNSGSLPSETIDALHAIKASGDYYFWSGTSKPKSAVGDYQRALRSLFDLAKTPRVHAHLFRHTFATELLTAGNSLETVAALLGHSSTKITERSYSHWIKGRQEKLEEAVKNSWTQVGHSRGCRVVKRQKPA
jgi:integrase